MLKILKKKKMTDFKKILDKAKELETKMKESQKKIRDIEVEGISGNNSVKVIINGDGEMIKVKLSEEIVSEEKTIIEDLIMAAHNNARVKLKSKTEEQILKATGELGIPGFKWPI
jgi:DNA-binding YbaB/EbfC family protein